MPARSWENLGERLMKHKPVPTHFRVLKECWNQDAHQRLKEGDIISGLSSFEVSRNLAEGNIVAHNDPIVPRVGHVVETQMVAPPETREIEVTRIESAKPEFIKIEIPAQPPGFFKRRGRPRK